MTPRTAHRAAACATLLTLAACGGDAPEEQAPTPSPTPNTETAAVPQDAIPPEMRGRWGLVAADCEPGRADAKGLMVVSADSLEFYESVGRLEEVEDATRERLSADFGFSGEGMEWDRAMVLVLEEDGSVLVREESGEDAMEGQLRYQRCPGAGA